MADISPVWLSTSVFRHAPVLETRFFPLSVTNTSVRVMLFQKAEAK